MIEEDPDFSMREKQLCPVFPHCLPKRQYDVRMESGLPGKDQVNNMIIKEYITDNWGLLVLLAGFFLILSTDVHLERKIVHRIVLIVSLLFIYSVSCHLESYYGTLEHYSIMRAVLSAADYSLVSFILVNVALILFPGRKRWLYLPAVLNAAASFISIPTGIVFYFSEANVFGRGFLGVLPFFVCGFYLAYLAFELFVWRINQREDLALLVFVFLTSAACLVVPLYLDDSNTSWFYLTISINVMLYYIFLLQQYTKRDPLTNLLNRQSYYADMEKHGSAITAVVTMDMNGLKEINDTEGHAAGDVALKALADCFWRASNHSHRLYRIGGDEYVIMCLNSSEDEVRTLVEDIRKEVAKGPYSCSIGYAMRSGELTVEKTYQLADQMLYEKKKEFYFLSGKDRRKT